MADSPKENNFGQDLAFLKKHLETVVLRNDEGGGVAIVPGYQGRTMTSTAGSDSGKSYGYINYDAIASDVVDPQINLYGGEDRIWISPEGGQNSIFFEPGVEMSFANWRTPAELDSQPFTVQVKKRDSVSLTKNAVFTNWSGTQFHVQIDRSIKLLNRSIAAKNLGLNLDAVQVSAHESHNTLINRGDTAWQADTGLIGLWLICMSKPAPTATLIVPFQATDDEVLADTQDADIVTADYFGELDDSRLKIDRENRLLYFRGDGQLRSKLGVSADRVSPLIGSWDPDRKVLSVISFNLPASAPNGYNNNLWEIQDDPYAGDVINCYNDGINDSGEGMTKDGFFEIETVSPALALAPGEGYTHIQRTVRMEGNRENLSAVANSLFGVDLEQIESQFDRL
jgi:hypothetical protein